jgi:hypothetical protein
VRVAYGYGIEEVIADAGIPANAPRHDSRVVEAAEVYVSEHPTKRKDYPCYIRVKTLDGNVYRIETGEYGDEYVQEPADIDWVEVTS